jgi:hypothetical protein
VIFLRFRLTTREIPRRGFREVPFLKLIVIEDALASNTPHIRLLEESDLRFILGAEQSDHTFLFDWVEQTSSTSEYALTDEKGIHHRFRYPEPPP